MTDSPYLPPVRLEAARERVIAELAEHFAHDHLDTAEFEARLDLVYQARTLADLDRLQTDLPALASAEERTRLSVPLATEDDVRNRQLLLAIMGGTERKGAWTPARHLDVLALMGGVELDFREAHFAPGVTRVNALAIMGGVEILVPPGVKVESEGVGIMGGFESFGQVGDDHPDTPVLRISGLALMGAVEIQQRLPGESARDARLRRREERRRLKRGG